MSTVPTTQPLLPKGCSVPKKMKRFLLFVFILGLFTFSMSIFIKSKFHSKHHPDNSILALAEEVKELKKSQQWSMKTIERLYNNQQRLVSEQSELRQIKDILVDEISRVENIALKSHEAYRQVQLYLQQQDNSMKSLARTIEMNKINGQLGSQDKNSLMMELRNTQNELANRLEAFRKILQNFEMSINNNNRKVAEDMREIKAWVSQNTVSQEDLLSVIQSNPNTQRQLVNEVNNQKNIVNQVAQNSLKQGNELKEISKVLNGLKEYTLEALQQLGQQNALNERRISGIERSKTVQGQVGKASQENQQLATEFKNFKEYTMEALQELRAFNNRNTKRINHIQSKDSETSISEVVSQEVEKFFNKLSDGQLLEKILEETNISMRDIQTVVNIVKMLTEGDIKGVMTTLNELTGGDFMKQMMNAKEDLLKEFKPIMKFIKKISGNDMDDVMKYASWIGDLIGGDSEKETPKVDTSYRTSYKQQKNQKKKYNKLDDLIQWAD